MLRESLVKTLARPRTISSEAGNAEWLRRDGTSTLSTQTVSRARQLCALDLDTRPSARARGGGVSGSLLHEQSTLEGRQVANYGLTAVPILQ